MTSNIGARQIKDFGTGVGFETLSQKEQTKEVEKGIIEKELKKTFSPEFLNRVDDLIVFNPLGKEAIRSIVDLEVEKVITRVEQLSYKLNISEAALDFIADKGFDTKNGARPLARAIQKYVEDLVAENIVANTIKEGDTLNIDHKKREDKLFLNVANEKEEAPQE